jgi:hypothetical protein
MPSLQTIHFLAQFSDFSEPDAENASYQFKDFFNNSNSKSKR